MPRLLVLGGSWFLGSRVVTDAVKSGWSVTTFRRGRTGSDVPGAHVVRGDRTSAADLARLADHGPWDAVVDTSGYVPANVRDVARALLPAAGRYIFLSTVSVYRDWPVVPVAEECELRDSAPDQTSEDGSPGDPGPARYGAFKAGCERAVLDVFGHNATVLLRPGVITGPGEYVGRLPWWLRRVARGGTVLAPGDPSVPIAPVDVRDVAAFVLSAVSGPVGAYNLSGSAGTFGGLLHACRDAVDSDAVFEWITDQTWLAERVGPWVELPLWHTAPAAWSVDDSRARDAGYETRPLTDIVTAVWSWMQSGVSPVAHPRAGLLGLDHGKETAVLAEWNRAFSS